MKRAVVLVMIVGLLLGVVGGCLLDPLLPNLDRDGPKGNPFLSGKWRESEDCQNFSEAEVGQYWDIVANEPCIFFDDWQYISEHGGGLGLRADQLKCVAWLSRWDRNC